MQEVQDTRVPSLGGEDPLQKGMATHSSILAWRPPWTGEPGRLQSVGSQRVRSDTAERLSTHAVDLGVGGRDCPHWPMPPRGAGHAPGCCPKKSAGEEVTGCLEGQSKL